MAHLLASFLFLEICWLFVGFLGKNGLFSDRPEGYKKTRNPLIQPAPGSELIARFELATSSLPRMRSTD